MCVNHFGRNFFVNARMQCKYVASTLANEVITTHGVVREKTLKGDGFRFTVEVWAENDDGREEDRGMGTCTPTASRTTTPGMRAGG